MEEKKDKTNIEKIKFDIRWYLRVTTRGENNNNGRLKDICLVDSVGELKNPKKDKFISTNTKKINELNEKLKNEWDYIFPIDKNINKNLGERCYIFFGVKKENSNNRNWNACFLNKYPIFLNLILIFFLEEKIKELEENIKKLNKFKEEIEDIKNKYPNSTINWLGQDNLKKETMESFIDSLHNIFIICKQVFLEFEDIRANIKNLFSKHKDFFSTLLILLKKKYNDVFNEKSKNNKYFIDYLTSFLDSNIKNNDEKYNSLMNTNLSDFLKNIEDLISSFEELKSSLQKQKESLKQSLENEKKYKPEEKTETNGKLPKEFSSMRGFKY